MARSPIELGIFLPVANNGWVMATSAPPAPPTWALNRRIAEICEEIGFDFLLSQSVWRGHGGETGFWDTSLECCTTMAALAAVTERLGLVASVSPLLFPPAVAAKMLATIDEVSGGRAGINVVSGAHLAEFRQLGMLPDDFGRVRYDYATEWIELVKRLWSEASVDHRGEWFHYQDAKSGPKPRQRPHPPIVCAGTSERGMTFTLTHGTHAFIGAGSIDDLVAVSDRYQATARALGREVKRYTAFGLIPGATDAEAAERMAALAAAPDVEAIEDMHRQYLGPGAGVSMRAVAESSDVFFGDHFAGGPDAVADHIEAFAVRGRLDGVLLTFPDWEPDLWWFAAEVMPRLRARGIVRTGPAPRWGLPLDGG